MNEKDFVKFCKKQIVNYTNEHLDKTDGKVIDRLHKYAFWKIFKSFPCILRTTGL